MSPYSQKTRQFLLDLRDHNTRDWFTENKSRYEAVVKKPSVAWVEMMGSRLLDLDAHLTVDTRTNGSGSLMRMARDVRFSADKSPYKTNIAMMWWRGAGKKTEHPAFGMQLTPDDAGLMTGMFGFSKPMLDAYRQAVDDDAMGGELVEIVQSLTAKGYELVGQHYKTIPRGYDKDHPRADLLKYNALYTHVTDMTWEQILSDEVVDICYAHFQVMVPIYHWLVDVQARYGGV